uniref:Uncharacterized protein n=1 Tax=viral metagenome TaxID=1070528 RepID=A0A6M3J5A5_9ZZZZ
MFPHLESTAGVDMEQWSHSDGDAVKVSEYCLYALSLQDSPSMPVQPVRIGFEPMR